MAMAWLLLLLQVFINISYIASYKISTINRNYADAIKYCNDTYDSSLATIYTPEQNKIARNLCLNHINNSTDNLYVACWIGLHQIESNSYSPWLWQQNGIESVYTYWAKGAPSYNNNNHTNCTEISVAPFRAQSSFPQTQFMGDWNNVDCIGTEFHATLCNDPPHGL